MAGFIQGNGNRKEVKRNIYQKLFSGKGAKRGNPSTSIEPKKTEFKQAHLSVRLTKADKAKLNQLAAVTGEAKSEIVRKSLQVFEASRKGSMAMLNGYIIDFGNGRVMRGAKSNNPSF